MTGKTDLLIPAVCAISSIAFVTDLVWGRIFNWLTVPALLAGIAASAWVGGWAGAAGAGFGAAAALVLYGWMFWFGAMGGGDVKFLMALGAWGGVRFVIEVACLGIALGGLMALFILVFKGRILDFSRRLHRTLLTWLVKGLEAEAPQVDRKLTMPFGLPIAVAAVWVAVASPFARLGVRLW